MDHVEHDRDISFNLKKVLTSSHSKGASQFKNNLDQVEPSVNNSPKKEESVMES
jgi:hypothetical protein